MERDVVRRDTEGQTTNELATAAPTGTNWESEATNSDERSGPVRSESDVDCRSRRTSRSRRDLLTTLGAGAGLAVAGCLGSAGETVTVGYQPFGTPYWSELVVKHGELAEEYMPDEYEVDWQSALQGTIIGNRMISGENQVGYNGDMPTLIALAQDDEPIAKTALSQWSWGQQCNAVITPTDSDIESVEDLDGADVGATSGACSHRALLTIQEEEGIEANMVDLDVNTILANVNQGELDAGIMWEPNPTMAVVQQESAEWVMTTARYGDSDTGSVTMTDAFIDDHFDAAVGFMKAELEAKQIMENEHDRAVELVNEEQDLDEYEPETIRSTMYENIPVNPDVKRMNFVTDLRQIEPARVHLQETAAEFLVEQGTIDEVPGEDRYRYEPLDEAMDELESEVDWDPRDDPIEA